MLEKNKRYIDQGADSTWKARDNVNRIAKAMRQTGKFTSFTYARHM
jgi:hypothetical protein